MENQQYVVLNEDDIEKIFWPAEEKLRLLGRQCGPSLKIFAVNDCCREDYLNLRKNLETEQEKSLREKFE